MAAVVILLDNSHEIDWRTKLLGLSILQRTLLNCLQVFLKPIYIIPAQESDWAEIEQEIAGHPLIQADQVNLIQTLSELEEQPSLFFLHSQMVCDKRFFQEMQDAMAGKIEWENGFKILIDGNIAAAMVKTDRVLEAPSFTELNSLDSLVTETLKVSPELFHLVLDPFNARIAESKLLKGVLKPLSVDGVICYYASRRLSGWLTRYIFVHTAIQPDVITLISFLLGILGAVVLIYGNYIGFVLGALLFQLSNVFDMCDGEVAKLKFIFSKNGQWYDTISDDITLLLFYACLGFGLFRYFHNPLYFYIGIGGTLFVLCYNIYVYYFLVKHNLGGDVEKFSQSIGAASNRGDNGFVNELKFLFRRDFLILMFLVFALVNQIRLVFFLYGIGSLILFIVAIHRMVMDHRLALLKPEEKKNG